MVLGVGGGGGTCACLLSSFLLFKTRYVRYVMMFWSMFFMRVLIFDFEMFKLVSVLMECLCVFFTSISRVGFFVLKL